MDGGHINQNPSLEKYDLRRWGNQTEIDFVYYPW